MTCLGTLLPLPELRREEWRGSLLAHIKMARSTMRGRQATGGISQCVLSPLYVVALAALVRTAPPISRVEVGTRWVQVFVAPTGVMPKDSGAPAAPAAPATGSVAFGGITSILVSAGFLPVCSTGNNGERMVAVTSNNIRVTGSHWGEPFVHRLRGGMPQGIEDRWRPREVAEKRTRRQARVERGKKLKALIGGTERQGRQRKKTSLQHRVFKSDWHKQRAMKQAERRRTRKLARKEDLFSGKASAPVRCPSSPPTAVQTDPAKANASTAVFSPVVDLGVEESVPSEFLAEMQQRVSADASDFKVLDGDGNEVTLDTPLHADSQEHAAVRSAQDLLFDIAKDAPLRPYSDANGNIKWIDERAPEDKYRQGLNDPANQAKAQGVSRLRGGGTAALRLSRAPFAPPLASHDATVRTTPEQSAEEWRVLQRSEKERMLHHDQQLLVDLQRKVLLARERLALRHLHRRLRLRRLQILARMPAALNAQRRDGRGQDPREWALSHAEADAMSWEEQSGEGGEDGRDDGREEDEMASGDDPATQVGDKTDQLCEAIGAGDVIEAKSEEDEVVEDEEGRHFLTDNMEMDEIDLSALSTPSSPDAMDGSAGSWKGGQHPDEQSPPNENPQGSTPGIMDGGTNVIGSLDAAQEFKNAVLKRGRRFVPVRAPVSFARRGTYKDEIQEARSFQEASESASSQVTEFAVRMGECDGEGLFRPRGCRANTIEEPLGYMHELYPGETQKITVEWGGNGLSDESNDSEIMSESGSGQEGEEGIPRAVNEGNGHRGMRGRRSRRNGKKGLDNSLANPEMEDTKQHCVNGLVWEEKVCALFRTEFFVCHRACVYTLVCVARAKIKHSDTDLTQGLEEEALKACRENGANEKIAGVRGRRESVLNSDLVVASPESRLSAALGRGTHATADVYRQLTDIVLKEMETDGSKDDSMTSSSKMTAKVDENMGLMKAVRASLQHGGQEARRVFLQRGVHESKDLLHVTGPLIVAGDRKAKLAARVLVHCNETRGREITGAFSSLYLSSSLRSSALSNGLEPLCCLCGTAEESSGPLVQWIFRDCTMVADRRTLLEVRGRADADLQRSILGGSEFDGEVNLCTNAIVLRMISTQIFSDRYPRVRVLSSVIRHSECGLRMVRCDGSDQGGRGTVVGVNSVFERNRLCCVLTADCEVYLRHCTVRQNSVAAYMVDTGSHDRLAIGCLVKHESVALSGATWADWRRPESWIFDGELHSGIDEAAQPGGYVSTMQRNGAEQQIHLHEE